MKASLGLDVGTTSIKAVVIGEDGALLAEAASGAILTSSAHPGWAVQSTESILNAVSECLKDVVTQLDGSAEIVAVAAAAQSGSIAWTDRAGRISDALITWMDTRSSPVVEEWKANGTAQAIRQICGWSVHPGQGLPQLAHKRATDASEWDDIARILSADDLVTNFLTEAWVTNPSNAAGMALLDISTGKWSSQLCDLIGVEPSQLSELRPSGTKISNLSENAAKATGLSQQAMVYNGGHDQTCTALALGVNRPGAALLSGGTAWVLTSVLRPEGIASVPEQLNISFHVAPGLRTTSKYLGGLGSSIEWFLRDGSTPAQGEDRFTALDAELASAITELTSPYFRPTPHIANQPGAGEFTGVSSTTTEADKARSIMEFATFELKSALREIPESHRPDSLTVVGGATRSPGWTQLIADVCELEVTVAADRAWPAIGAAILAGASSGLLQDIDAGVAALNPSNKQIKPNEDMIELYRARYEHHLSQEPQP